MWSWWKNLCMYHRFRLWPLIKSNVRKSTDLNGWVQYSKYSEWIFDSLKNQYLSCCEVSNWLTPFKFPFFCFQIFNPPVGWKFLCFTWKQLVCPVNETAKIDRTFIPTKSEPSEIDYGTIQKHRPWCIQSGEFQLILISLSLISHKIGEFFGKQLEICHRNVTHNFIVSDFQVTKNVYSLVMYLRNFGE